MAPRAANNPRQIRSKNCGCTACLTEYPPDQYGERRPRRDCTGSWQARYRDPAGKQRAKNFRTRGEAIAFLDSVRTAVRSRTYHDPKRGEITLGAWWDLWWPSQGGRIRTRNRKESNWNAHIAPKWRDVPLNALEHMAIQSWLTQDVKGHESQRKVLELLRAMLADAVRDNRRIPFNPAAEVRVTAIAVPKHPDDLRPPTEKQYALVREALPSWYRPLVDWAQETGMRWGEYTAMRRCNVDRDAALAYVREVVIDDDGVLRRQIIPKSAAALRSVPLTPKALEAYDIMIERLAPATTRSAIEDGMHPEELLFRGPLAGEQRRQKDGTVATLDSVLSRNNFRRVWIPAIQAAGIARKIKNPETGRTEWWPRVHDYRHAVASRLHEAGVPEVDVQAFLGQERGSRVTWNYTHTSDASLAAARDALAGVRRLRVVHGVHDESTRPPRRDSASLGTSDGDAASAL
ncbi:tyrosine-type recombinase/integrase [Actinacidiphila sp. DG2A-62]|uniref:tyrosine-type recombinase/integrase n=1 Tax=Actinacidiphila sp. DG2A-62 TaxID=3108821 RepID=UPI002DC05936|nr:tyrosine-type recombinase/integrase [Actinacidiphila sp. DG2A-62]MEC3993953.1 tyrosine-type recombinase/integrase [Actinacidiphila sp. DG2A-62]